MKKYILLLVWILFQFNSKAQNRILINITDSITNEPISYASVSIGKNAKLTDDFGQTVIQVENTLLPDTLYISMIGYYPTKLVVTKLIIKYNIKLTPKNFQLNEVSITGYSDKDLVNKLIKSFKNTSLKNKSFAANLNTYTTKNINEPIERLSGSYNFKFAGNKLNDIELKYGNIIFPNEELNNNFLSIGITKLYTLVNPFGVKSANQFAAPYTLPSNKFLENYKLSYDRIDGSTLKINFKSKNGLTIGYAVIHTNTLELLEVNMIWQFVSNYPLVSINQDATISDTMTISTNTYYQNAKFTNQLLRLNFIYNGIPIKTRSIASFADSTLHNTPINNIEFNNDYLNILSRPSLDKITRDYDDNLNNLGKLDSIFNIGIEEETLINAVNLNPELITELTNISFYEDDWRLNWGKVGKSNSANAFDTKIATHIYADRINVKDTVIYIIEPLLDYANTYFDYERDAKAAIYISNYFYLTKIQANELHKELKAAQLNTNDYLEFVNLVKKHDSILKKRLWKYKLETNGGNNELETSKWNSTIYKELSGEN